MAKTLYDVKVFPEMTEYQEKWDEKLALSGLDTTTFPSRVCPPDSEITPKTVLRYRFWRAEIDYPGDPEYWRARKLEQDKKDKFMSPKAVSAIIKQDRRRLNMLYLHESINWGFVKGNPDTPLFVTEGEVDAASFCLHTGLPCIGIAGIWNWIGKHIQEKLDSGDKPKVLQAGFGEFTLEGRRVILLYDADGKKGGIRDAMFEFSRSLRKAGAEVSAYCCAPLEEGGEVDHHSGVGDWIGYWLRQGKEPLAEFQSAVRINGGWYEFSTDIDPILDMYRDCHHVIHGGKARVIKPEKDECGGTEWIAHDLKELAEVDPIRLPNPDQPDGAPIPGIKRWAMHPHRKNFQGGTTIIPYRPDEDGSPDCPPGKLNMFRGWPTKPVENAGSWAKVDAYFRDVLCNGDETSYEFFMFWLAHMFQHPATAPGIIVVLFSEGEGTGKSFLVEVVINLLMGELAVVIADSDMITGKFNGITGQALCVLGEEIAWVGNRAGTAKLRALATAQKLMVEHKGLMPYRVFNFTRLVKALNGQHVADMGVDDRRYFLLEVSAREQQNTEYFAAIEQELMAGGAEALLWHLLNGVKVGKKLPPIPDSDTRTDQAMMNLDPFDSYLLWLIDGGEAFPDNMLFKWGPQVDKRLLRTGFDWWLKHGGHRINEWDQAAAWKPFSSPTSPAIKRRVTKRTPSITVNKTNSRMLNCPRPDVAREEFVGSFRKGV